MNPNAFKAQNIGLMHRWVKIPVAMKYSGLCRNAIYDLLGTGALRSFLHKTDPSSRWGVRLISLDSLDDYLEACADQVEGQPVRIPKKPPFFSLEKRMVTLAEARP
jgi:hypothetical protein